MCSWYLLSPPQWHWLRSGWSCHVVWLRHSGRLSQWCGAQRGCLPFLLCPLASDCKSAEGFKMARMVTCGKSPKVTKIKYKSWHTMPSSTLKPSWYLGSGLRMIAMVTGGQWTILSLTYFWFFKSYNGRYEKKSCKGHSYTYLLYLMFHSEWIDEWFLWLFPSFKPNCQHGNLAI